MEHNFKPMKHWIGWYKIGGFYTEMAIFECQICGISLLKPYNKPPRNNYEPKCERKKQ